MYQALIYESLVAEIKEFAMYDNYSVKCGKLSFKTEYDAERKIEQREFDNNGWHGRAYQCSNCRNWHISTDRENSSTADDLLFRKRSENSGKNNGLNRQSVEKPTVEGSRIVDSYSGGSSHGSTVFDGLDEETLKKLGFTE